MVKTRRDESVRTRASQRADSAVTVAYRHAPPEGSIGRADQPPSEPKPIQQIDPDLDDLQARVRARRLAQARRGIH